MTSISLRTGNAIPVVGLGVFQAGESTHEAVEHAIRHGYRHIDTAAGYKNEAAVGKGVRASGVPREEIFITTKCIFTDFQGTLDSAAKSLAELEMDYVDLLLIHWPTKDIHLDAWRALEQLYDEGKARAIGVSNYMVEHLQQVMAVCRIVPHVNQVELHPYCTRPALQAFCRQHGIVLEAFSPLTRGISISDTVQNEIAKAHNKSPAQVLLRWSVQKGFVTLPKSVKPARIEENFAIFDFELTSDEMARLDMMDRAWATSETWDPARYDIDKNHNRTIKPGLQ